MHIFRQGRHGKKAGESCFLRPKRIVVAGDKRDDGYGCKPFNLYFNMLVMPKDSIGDEGE